MSDEAPKDWRARLFRLRQIIEAGRKALQLWAAVDSGEVRPEDSDAQALARRHLVDMSAAMAALGMADELDPEGLIAGLHVDAGGLRGAAVWQVVREGVARVVANADAEAVELETFEDAEAWRRGEVEP